MSTDDQGCPVGHHQAAQTPVPKVLSRSPHRNVDEIDPHDLDMTAFWSDPRVRARESVVQIDTDMQVSYAALKAELIKHLSPVIVVNNEERGGEYTLVLNGKTESLHPISRTFELAKSVAHVPLGIFSVIAPYLNRAETTDWAEPLSAFGRTLRTARERLRDADMPSGLEASSRVILDAGIAYIDKAVADGHVSIASFEQFSASVYPSIRTNMKFAADAQIRGVRKIMKKWKKQIGEKGWKDLYVVVLSIWTTSVLNQNSIIIRTLMDPGSVDSHLIDLPAAEFPADPVFVALDNLARIVQDNVAAEMVFPTDQVVADALKGPEDLLSQTILGELDEDGSEEVVRAS
ncbi:hypothetical protein [Aeromicrobium alkaliterrae]|uniref:Uncharacterized protein n=1 Tax=Aeromicrobium alkaliterrae TaxID=302168 RepID=A0ABN2KFG2_9ACTN